MKTKISDEDVIRLLRALKTSEDIPTQSIIESNRDLFKKQVAAMVILREAGIHEVNAAGSGSSVGASITTVLETALAIVLLAEAGVAAYIYREKIAAFFNSTFGPKVEQVVNPPDNSFIDTITTDESSGEFFTNTPTPTATTTPTSIPPLVTPSIQANNAEGIKAEVPVTSHVTSTPDPQEGNNGLHLGQTKQPSIPPKPTKEPKTNNSDESKNNNKDK